MNEEMKPVNPSLALVIAIGQLPRDVIAEVAPIFLSGRPERQHTTRFLSVHAGKKLTLLPWQEALSQKDERSRTYAEYGQAGMDAADDLKKMLETTLHDLRTHEHLMQAGLGGLPTLPLDITLLADLSHPVSALLFPLAILIESVLAGEPFGWQHLLLNTATFLAGDEILLDDATVYANLQALEGFLDGPEENLRSLLASKTGSSIPQSPYAVYLFDRTKEGLWDVKDVAELKIVMGNFLLAMLSGGLAQHLTRVVPQVELAESRTHYRGAAATALVLDKARLHGYCASRMALDVLKREFDPKIEPQPRLVEDNASEILGKIGSLSDWIEQTCAGSLFHIRHNRGSLLEIHFANLQFEGLPVHEWGEAIHGHDAWFGSQVFPAQQVRLANYAETLGAHKSTQLASILGELPQRAGFYPGGVRVVREIVSQLIAHIQTRATDLYGEHADAIPDYDAALQEALQRLDQAVEKLPQPPAILRRLPAVLRRPALMLFDLIFLNRDHARLAAIRERCVRLVEQKYVHLAETEVRQRLAGLCLRMQDELQNTSRSLEKLQKALRAAQKNIHVPVPENAPVSLFRLSACDQAAADWAYRQVQKSADELRLPLFEEHRILQGWNALTAKTIAARLLEFCGAFCQPVMQITLEEVLEHRAQDDRRNLYDTLIQGAVPLLRPDFDRVGSGQSFQSQFFLCADPRTSTLAGYLKELPSEWQATATADPSMGLACRVRYLIPMQALADLNRRTQQAYEALDDPVRQQLQFKTGERE